MKSDILSQVKILSIGILSIFLVLITGMRIDALKNVPQNSRTEEVIASSMPSISSDSKSNAKDDVLVKNYRNEKYAYSFDYPADWVLYSDDPADIFIQPIPDKASDLPISHEGALEIKVSEVPPNANLAKIVSKKQEAGFDFKEEDFAIDGMPALKIDTTICRAEACHVFEWFALKNDYLYHLSSIYPDAIYNENFDRIISTVKFLDAIK